MQILRRIAVTALVASGLSGCALLRSIPEPVVVLRGTIAAEDTSEPLFGTEQGRAGRIVQIARDMPVWSGPLGEIQPMRLSLTSPDGRPADQLTQEERFARWDEIAKQSFREVCTGC